MDDGRKQRLGVELTGRGQQVTLKGSEGHNGVNLNVAPLITDGKWHSKLLPLSLGSHGHGVRRERSAPECLLRAEPERWFRRREWRRRIELGLGARD